MKFVTPGQVMDLAESMTDWHLPAAPEGELSNCRTDRAMQAFVMKYGYSFPVLREVERPIGMPARGRALDR